MVDRRVWDPNNQEKNWIFSSFTKCFHFLYNFTQCFQTFKKTLFLLTHFLFNSPQEIIVVVIIIILVIVAQCDNRRDGGGQNSFLFFVDFSHFFLNWFQWIRLRIGKRTKYFWAGEFNREDNEGRRGLQRLWLTLSFQDPTLHLNYKLLLNPKLMMILLLFSSPFIPRSGGVSLTTHDTGSLIFFPTQSEKVRRKTMFKSSLKKRKKKDPKWPTNNLIHR